MAEPQMISAAKFREFTGLSEKELRLRVKEGFVPTAVKGQYEMLPAIAGLLRYFRELRESKPEEVYYDSIANAAAILNIKAHVLKSAKKKGCPAFKGSRVYLFPLIQWMLSRPEDETTAMNWFEEKARVQTLREEVKLKREELQAADWDDVAFGLNKGMALLSSDLDKLFSQTLPKELARLPELQIKNKLARRPEALMATLRSELAKLGDLETKPTPDPEKDLPSKKAGEKTKG